MNIFLTLKCGYNDAVYFIQQFSEQNKVENVFVFRDTNAADVPKVKYITNYSPILQQFNFIIRFWQVLQRKRLNPLVIVGIYEIPHGLLAVLAGKLLQKPSIVSIIGNPAYSRLRKGFRMKLTMWILNHANFVTVTGSNSKCFLISKGIPAEKVFVLPNSMDFSNFYPVPGIAKEYDLISLGRLSEEKKVEQIIHTVAALQKVNPDIKAAIGGTGPEKENLRQLIIQLKLEQNIEIMGYIPDDELPAFLSKGKVFLLSSETEGFPRTIIQAAACGAAIVATNVGDMTDVIDHEVNGFLVDNYLDIDSFVKYVQLLLADSAMAQSFVSKLNIKVREQFDNSKATEVWGEILNQITRQ